MYLEGGSLIAYSDMGGEASTMLQKYFGIKCARILQFPVWQLLRTTFTYLNVKTSGATTALTLRIRGNSYIVVKY